MREAELADLGNCGSSGTSLAWGHADLGITRSFPRQLSNGGAKVLPPSKLTVERETHDHGLVKQNQTVAATFTLMNPGSVPIEIIKVSKSCSCSEATLSSQMVPAGGQVTMTVDWQTRDRVGPVEVPISVAYQQQDGRNYGVLQCAIRGTVQPKFQVDPRQIIFGKERTAKIQLKPGYEAPPKIASVKSSEAKLLLQHTEDTVTVIVPEDQPIPDRGLLLIFAEGSPNPVCEVRMFQKPE
jgi:hypothetical protein